MRSNRMEWNVIAGQKNSKTNNYIISLNAIINVIAFTSKWKNKNQMKNQLRVMYPPSTYQWNDKQKATQFSYHYRMIVMYW